AHVKTIDKVTGTSFEASAAKIVASLFSAPGTKTKTPGLGAIKSADLTGPVTIIYSAVDQSGSKTVTTATADSATYDGIERVAHLTGNVKIVSDNPALFDEPAVMTGDVATVDLKSAAGPAIKIESTNGLSRIEATPKKQEPQKK
ncbi:MAG: hypothetical protein ABFD54_08495, partial [Armatimonadota bacterium]